MFYNINITMQNQQLEQAMKNSGLATAATPELSSDFQFNTLDVRTQAQQEMQMLGMKGGAKSCPGTHVMLKGSKRKYVVRMDCRKRYIQYNKQKVYLSTIKGKYTYV